MPYLDFDTLILHHHSFRKDDLVESFSFFAALGIKHFIFTYELDCDLVSVSRVLSEGRSISELLRASKPRGARCYLTLQPVLIKDLSAHEKLSHMVLPHSDRLFMTLPMFVGDDWVPTELNHLLYKRHLKPVFVGFERNLKTNSDRLLQDVSHIASAVYAMDAMFLTSPDGFAQAETMIAQGLSVFPCVSGRTCDYAGIQKSYLRLAEAIGRMRYQAFCRSTNYTKSSLLGSLLTRPRR